MKQDKRGLTPPFLASQQLFVAGKGGVNTDIFTSAYIKKLELNTIFVLDTNLFRSFWIHTDKVFNYQRLSAFKNKGLNSYNTF